MSTDKLDFKYLATAVLSRVNEYLPSWLPGGKMYGKEYCCASIRGGDGKSFKVNVSSGKWADFAAGDKGGDLISLYAAINGLSQFQAAQRLAAEVGHRLPDPRDNIKPPPAGPVFVKPPKGTKMPDFKHIDYGEPSVKYTYRDESGDVLFFVCRYDPAGERKQFIPFSYTSAGNWVRKMWPAPRPLFGLELLSGDYGKRGEKSIMIVEGEKAAIAARMLVGDNYDVVTWHGGGNAVDKADWSPIYGKRILIWPDADEPGRMCALKLAGILVDKVKSVKILNLPETMFDGWDAADAISEGWTWDKFKLWAKEIVTVFEVKPKSKALVPEIMPMPEAADAPHDLGISFYAGIDESILDQPVKEPVAVIHTRCGVTYTGGKNPQPIMNSDNVLKLFTGVDYFKDTFWYDDFHKRLFARRGDKVELWDDVDTIMAMTKLQREYGFLRVNKSTVHDALVEYAFSNVKNEALEFIKSVAWDGVSRIDRFFIDAFKSEDNEYNIAVSRNMWLSIAARIKWPGCKVDNMVILEGKQGMFKSTALMELGGKFYGKTSGVVGTKDFYLSLQGRIIVEMGELASMSKSEVNIVKDMLSTPVDMFRPPYDRHDKPFPRTCIFVGTTNDNEYLHDVTGARRFWPVKVNEGELSYIKKFRMQFFAEAMARIERGEEWWHVPKAMAEAEQEARRVSDAWETVIEQWLDKRQGDIIMQDIGVNCLGIEVGRLDRSVQLRIGKILRVLGWQGFQTFRGGCKKRVWRKADDHTIGYGMQMGLNVDKKKVIINYADRLNDNDSQLR